MNLIDSHCHLDVNDFAADRVEILQRCRRKGINKIVVPAISRSGWDQLLKLCLANEQLYPALGLHPMFLTQHDSTHLSELALYVRRHNLVAVGEIGLDFYIKDQDRDRQQALFGAQLIVANEAKLPVILHIRKAHDLALRMLKQTRHHGGIVHAFSGSAQQAAQYISMGFKLGFGGMLTYERSRKLRTLAKQLPLEAIVLETDAPDMVVADHRGERNSPEYLTDCLAALAGLRGLTEEVIAQQTTQNVLDVLPKLRGSMHIDEQS